MEQAANSSVLGVNSGRNSQWPKEGPMIRLVAACLQKVCSTFDGTAGGENRGSPNNGVIAVYRRSFDCSSP